jgi:hypothetical protein
MKANLVNLTDQPQNFSTRRLDAPQGGKDGNPAACLDETFLIFQGFS